MYVKSIPLLIRSNILGINLRGHTSINPSLRHVTPCYSSRLGLSTYAQIAFPNTAIFQSSVLNNHFLQQQHSVPNSCSSISQSGSWNQIDSWIGQITSAERPHMQMIVRRSIQCDNSRQIHSPRTDLTAWLAGGGRGTKKGHVIVIWWIGGGPFNSEGESGLGYTIL